MYTGTEKILVVDDDDTIRDGISQMLCLLGYAVLSAESGEKGFALFLKNKFDLVITDFNMSGMDGIHLAYQIKEKSPSTLVVLMTGEDKEVILAKIKGNAVAKALFKPFSLVEMGKTIQGLLHP